MTPWVIVGCLVVAGALWPARGPVWANRRPWSAEEAAAPTAGDRGSRRRAANPATSALAVAATMDLIVLSLAGGGGVVDAVDGVAMVSAEEVRRRLVTVVAAVRWGVPWGQAWALAGPEWRRVGTAFALAAELGVAPTGPLSRAAADLRTHSRHEGGLAAARLGVRLVLPLGLTFLPAFVLVTVVPLVVALAGQLVGP